MVAFLMENSQKVGKVDKNSQKQVGKVDENSQKWVGKMDEIMYDIEEKTHTSNVEA